MKRIACLILAFLMALSGIFYFQADIAALSGDRPVLLGTVIGSATTLVALALDWLTD
jgi:hypothetical protein